MTLAEDILRELPAFRAAAEALMLDTGKALRPTGGFEYDPETDSDVEAADELFADVPCKVQTRNLVARETEVGARTSVSIRTELHMPADTDPLRSGDLWEITAAHALSLSTVGQRLRIVGPVSGTLKTARRYEVEEVVS